MRFIKRFANAGQLLKRFFRRQPPCPFAKAREECRKDSYIRYVFRYYDGAGNNTYHDIESFYNHNLDNSIREAEKRWKHLKEFGYSHLLLIAMVTYPMQQITVWDSREEN